MGEELIRRTIKVLKLKFQFLKVSNTEFIQMNWSPCISGLAQILAVFYPYRLSGPPYLKPKTWTLFADPPGSTHPRPQKKILVGPCTPSLAVKKESALGTILILFAFLHVT